VGSEEPLSVGTGEIWIPRFFCIGLKLEYRQPPQNTRSMSLHIGKRIKEVLERQGRTKVWFAKEINRTPAACYHIFQCPTIDTGLLETISKKLHHDFFQDLSADSNIK